MSLKHKILSFFTLVLTVAAFSTAVSAQDSTNTDRNPAARQERHHQNKGDRQFGKPGKFGREGHGGRRGGKMMMRGLHQLNLTEAQKTQIRSLMESNRTVNESAMQEMRQLAMKKRGGATLTDSEQARFTALKEQLKASGEQTHNSVLAILTAEQRAQLEQMKAERKQKMEQRKQMRQNRQNSTKPLDN